ncbi:hypothetical protein [Streptomyces sp. NPDC058202]|uniref:hypothetical protein n=1 Tax=Streptomyces sp. NPDC058202 TaxID=3346380 RepID=UPI0036ED6728
MNATATTKTTPSPARRSNVISSVVVAAVVVVGLVLVLLNSQQQDRLSTVRQTQVSGQRAASGQRTDQTQVTCALWALLREDKSGRLPASVQLAVDRICSGVPTPAPSD